MALDAVVRGVPTDEAYTVIEQAGWHELFFGCVYKEESTLEANVAREIITRAKKDETFAGPMPEDDETCVKEAQNLVEMAEQAWAQHIRGPEVEAILNIAKGNKNGDAPKAEVEAESKSEGSSDDEESTTEVQTPKAFQGLDKGLVKMEPYDGYGDDTVASITEAINYYVEEAPDDIQDVLKHIWAYESGHKKRSRVLKFVIETYKRVGGEVETPEAEAEAEGTEEGSGPDTGEDVPSSEESQGQEDSESTESDASDDAEPEASQESGEGQADEGKSDAESKSSGSGGSKGNPYEKLVAQVDSEIKAERLDVPSPPEEKAPDLPWKWSETSDSQLHDYHMQYAACAYYKAYQLAVQERIAMHCKEAADQLHNAKLISINKYDDKNKEKKVAVIEAEINSDPSIKRWRKLQRKHEQNAAQAKRELESYHKVVEALSRLETMRHNSWERARR